MAASTLSAIQREFSRAYRLRLVVASVLVAGFCHALVGCEHAAEEGSAQTPPTVTVSVPVEREVTDYKDFTARTAAVDSVELRARVSGHLEKVNFKEGALVNKGDVLFEIDPRPYQAELDKALAQVKLAEAQLKVNQANYSRAREVAKTPGAISTQEVDEWAAKVDVTIAQVAGAKAHVESALLNLGFCKVTAPISGRISRYHVTVGNLVQPGDLLGGTLLTTIVSVDPMYAYFDVDEHTVLRVKQLVREGKAKTPDDPDIPVWLGLANEKDFPHHGVVNFIDNQVNPKTGTLRVRGVFPNKDESLAPGHFARVRVPIGVPHKALLVTERALDTDQGQKIVYVVDKDHKVGVRPVRLGALHDGLREITEGLQPGDRVIVTGLQQVRPGMTVEPKLVEMSAESRASGAASARLSS